VNVKTKRYLGFFRENALSILRAVAKLFTGGNLVFDCPTGSFHLYTVSGRDSGALFAFKKNMKSIERRGRYENLITRLYAIEQMA